MTCFAGIMLLAVALIVRQIVSFRLTQLYPITALGSPVLWIFGLWLCLHSSRRSQATVGQ